MAVILECKKMGKHLWKGCLPKKSKCEPYAYPLQENSEY